MFIYICIFLFFFWKSTRWVSADKCRFQGVVIVLVKHDLLSLKARQIQHRLSESSWKCNCNSRLQPETSPTVRFGVVRAKKLQVCWKLSGRERWQCWLLSWSCLISSHWRDVSLGCITESFSTSVNSHSIDRAVFCMTNWYWLKDTECRRFIT